MEYYKELVNCKKIIQKWVSIYETCDYDIRAPDIHRFPQVDGLSTGPPGIGTSQIWLLKGIKTYYVNVSKLNFIQNG